jgi:hypothetical protein
MMSFFDGNASECRGPCRQPAPVPQKIYRSLVQAELRPRNLWSFPLTARIGARDPLGVHRSRRQRDNPEGFWRHLCLPSQQHCESQGKGDFRFIPQGPGELEGVLLRWHAGERTAN